MIGLVFWIILSQQTIVALSSGTVSIITESNSAGTNETIPIKPVCGGELKVGIVVQKLSIPQSNDGASIECTWLLKTGHHKHKIGLTTVDTELNFGTGQYFKLESRDGKDVNSSVLGVLSICNESLVSMDWSFEKTIVSSTNYMLLKYVNHGNNPLVMNLLYYTCGGEADSETRIASPIFSPDHSVVQVVECQWNLTKPPDALYGSLSLIDVSISECSALQFCTNGGMQNVEYVEKIQLDTSSNTTYDNSSLANDEISTKPRFVKKSSLFKKSMLPNSTLLCTHRLPDGNKKAQTICGNTTKLIAFDGSMALLIYRIKGPVADIGFRAQYFPVRIPTRIASKPVPWYINYSALIIHAPVGVVLGMLIICCSSRKRGPTRKEMKLLGAAMFTSEPEPSAKLNAFHLSTMTTERVSPRATHSLALQALKGVQMVVSREETQSLLEKHNFKLNNNEKISLNVTCEQDEQNNDIFIKTPDARRRSESTLDISNESLTPVRQSSTRKSNIKHVTFHHLTFDDRFQTL